MLKPQQEKIMIKEIEDLEKSLPYSIPLSNLEKKIKEISKNKKDLGTEMNAAYNDKKAVEDELKDLENDFQNFKGTHTKDKQDLEPLI